METADIIVVNKADGDLTGLADQTRYQIQSIIKVFIPPTPSFGRFDFDLRASK